MTFTINGIEFVVESYPSGFSWVGDDDAGDEYFTCRYMAQQDAIDYMKRKMLWEEIQDQQRFEDETFGTYKQQINKLYYATR